jgi:hypothetical protein
MRIVQITCPNCGGQLNIDEEKKKDYCKYCGTPIFLDDEINHVEIDVTEEAGYKFEKGRIKAQEEKIQEERDARIRKEQEAKRLREEQKELQRLRVQEEIKAKQERNKKNRPKAIIIILIIVFAVFLLVVFLCCGGMSLFSKLFRTATDQVQTTGMYSNTSKISKKTVTSFVQLNTTFVDELKAKADAEVESYISANAIDTANVKENLVIDKYLGCCFGYDETNGNELFYVYQIQSTCEAIDNVNLRKFIDERPIFIYVGYKNILKDSDNNYDYDEFADFTEIKTPDFTAKSIYNVNLNSFCHNGFPYVSDLIDEIETNYSEIEYSSSKDKMIEEGHRETADITFFSDNTAHCGVWDFSGYVDESGMEYNECYYPYHHFAFTDPVCLDYRVGSEYNTLTFTYGPRTGYYYDTSEVYVRIIDKDTFDVILETDKIVVGQSNTIDVDITNHKNIRIQFVEDKNGIEYLMVKDVILSNKEKQEENDVSTNFEF